MSVLAINAGSSSIKFAFHGSGDPPARLLGGKLERIGHKDAALSVSGEGGPRRESIEAGDFRSAVNSLTRWLGSQPLFAQVEAVGQRIVHGMQRSEPTRVTPEVLREIEAIGPIDPEHLPQELALIHAVRREFPELPQVLCFDTAFHRTLPRVASLLPIPRRYDARGIRRYGFHGLSYTFLIAELARRGDPAASRGRVILAHLGNGASLAAVRDGRCIDTSMSFTPAAGLPMSTRTGDLDPGLVGFLARSESMTPEAFERMVNHESGLLGISETSSDVAELLAREHEDTRAAEAIAVFCYQAKKWLGAFAGALGGLDTLVFAGGIGEHAAPVRERICAGLEFLGIELCEDRNRQNAPRISSDASKVAVRVIATDEESVIAQLTRKVLDGG